MNLMEDLLDHGRTLCTDNYYTSVALADELLDHKTHLIGTLRSNRKINPKIVIDKKLKTGETVAEESNTGVIVQKWKDKRDVLMLSTKQTDEMCPTKRRGKETLKPKNVVEYNKYKSLIIFLTSKKVTTLRLEKV
ncbi:Transposase IS4 [Popillia japonica]|uniref:Transposase IS4 n=1 Tax=Popillia japonica TaxID=7064 RepID=A0AAW1HSA7_POPJA